MYLFGQKHYPQYCKQEKIYPHGQLNQFLKNDTEDNAVTLIQLQSDVVLYLAYLVSQSQENLIQYIRSQ